MNLHLHREEKNFFKNMLLLICLGSLFYEIMT